MSYRDSLDPRPSRRHDSFTKPRETYLSPNAGYDETMKHLEPLPTRVRTHSTDSRRAERRDRDERSPHPPTIRSSATAPSRHAAAPLRSRRSWPPAPVVENEAASLAKEAGGNILGKSIGTDEVPSRGSIDQDPLIQEVPEFANLHERRFVMLSGKGDRKHSGVPTPPTSEDEKARRGRCRPSRITTDFDPHLPELINRTSSLYAFAKEAPSRKPETPSTGYLSPDVLTPPLTDSRNRRKARVASDSHPAASPRVSPNVKKGDRDYFSATCTEGPLGDRGIGSTPAHSAAGKLGAPNVPSTGSRPSVADFASTPNPPPPLGREPVRRQTDSASSLPKSRGLDKAYRPSPLASTAVDGAVKSSIALALAGKPPQERSPTTRNSTLGLPEPRREGSIGSRNASPVSNHSHRADSPPLNRSPRYSAEYPPDLSCSSPDSKRESAISSRTGSRPGTPPSVVAMPKIPQTDLDWNNLLAANASRRPKGPNTSKAPSRLSTSMRADSMPSVARSGMTSFASPRPPTLPYPVDQGYPASPSVFMPVEQDHQWFPPTKPTNHDTQAPGPPTKTANPDIPTRGPSTKPTNLDISTRGPLKPARLPSPTSPVASRASPRPSFPPRHSFTTTSPAETKAPTLRQDTSRAPPTNAVGPTKQEAEAMLKRGLPGCSRPDPVANHHDWYTLVGAPSLDFCPDCIEGVFERTAYRRFFRRSLPRDLATKIQCAFGTPWIRLAYLLTVQQRLPDCHLMKDMVDIDASDYPCSGSEEAVRPWHGVRDVHGLFVRDFQICYADVRKIERLLPTFNGFFPRLPPQVSHEKRRCSLRADSNRFTAYLEAIIGLHDASHAARRLPDPMPFVALVEHKLALRECERDNLLLDGLWHYIPALPSFTVCEDCFEQIVEPEIRRGAADLPRRFNRAIQPAYVEGIGVSCQLYSRRMRKVFAVAVEADDFRYLARKARDRRDAELRLQERYREIMRRAKRHEERSGPEDDEALRLLEKDLERISVEWKRDWE